MTVALFRHVALRIALMVMLPAEPSTVVSLIDDQIEVLRQGKGILVMDT